jgi:hypothetical protein
MMSFGCEYSTRDEALIDIQISFVLSKITNGMTFIEHTPDLEAPANSLVDFPREYNVGFTVLFKRLGAVWPYYAV